MELFAFCLSPMGTETNFHFLTTCPLTQPTHAPNQTHSPGLEELAVLDQLDWACSPMNKER